MPDNMPKSYYFIDRSYSSLRLLANAMGLRWREGKNELFTGKLTSFFNSFDQSMANKCRYAEQEKRDHPDLSDYIFLKWLCKVPEIQGLYWHGRNYGTTNMLGQNLQKNEPELQKVANRLLRDQMFSVFAESNGMQAETVDCIKYIENGMKKEYSYHKKDAYLLLSFVLLNQHNFSFEGNTFTTIESFSSYLRDYIIKSQTLFENKVRKLYVEEDNLLPSFEGWLLNLGRKDVLVNWRSKYLTVANDTDDPDDILDPDDEAERKKAQTQELEKFAGDVFEFENRFTSLLSQYGDRIDMPRQFEGLIKDFFPQQPLQSYLLITLFRMDIASSILETDVLDDLFISRFIKRLVEDFGVKKEFAHWAASVWCVCYGAQYLHKQCNVMIYKVI